MIINDYFDAEKHTDKEEKNLIVAGVIDKKEVLNFLFFSYLLEILGILSLDSLDLSLIISTSLLITVLYTPLFKPVAWLKNISVAIVVASTPLVGALSAGGDSNYDNGAAAAAGAAAATGASPASHAVCAARAMAAASSATARVAGSVSDTNAAALFATRSMSARKPARPRWA